MGSAIARRYRPGDMVRVRDDDGTVSEPIAVRSVYSTSGGLRLEQAALSSARMTWMSVVRSSVSAPIPGTR